MFKISLRLAGVDWKGASSRLPASTPKGTEKEGTCRSHHFPNHNISVDPQLTQFITRFIPIVILVFSNRNQTLKNAASCFIAKIYRCWWLEEGIAAQRTHTQHNRPTPAISVTVIVNRSSTLS